ncbi:hypothetical protein BofuT4_P151740.1 [Botrytis cinerea T4]|uniref:RNase MRP protein 1 RNA binding domain-containing protein n=1 Tax=Botryotinia fuckeliana (strain T4) TaxID=999810 RepID=G2YWP4_BOTF4|nr:hypothetical protein BofuT4_P151740.1 [Botrytis cinerea T4]
MHPFSHSLTSSTSHTTAIKTNTVSQNGTYPLESSAAKAFSQLVANNQYATLGLMLMGCLARLYKVLGALRVLTAEEIAEQAGVVKETPQLNEAEIVEDMGEKIMRDVPVSEVEDSQTVERKEEDDTDVKKAKPKKRKQDGEVVESKASKLASSSDSIPAKPPKKKRKKKGGDAIEDLFAGLI